MAAQTFSVFITGGTGYIGAPLIRELVERGHTVRALVRPGSEKKLPSGAEAIPGNALDASSYSSLIQPSHTFVQLVGVAPPQPGEGSRVPDHRPGIRSGCDLRGASSWRAAFHLSQRGATGTDHEELSAGASRVRICSTGKRFERYYRPPVVRARARSSVALRSITDVLVVRAYPLNSRRRPSPGLGHALANDANTGLRRRKP
jgi:hypothetical protein